MPSLRQTLPIGSGAKLVVLTGLSGAGKSEAVRALEDLGYFCVDNLPTSLIATFAADLSTRRRRAAIVVDMRDPNFLKRFPAAWRGLQRRKTLGAVLIFLEASDAALVRRFSENRRPHPVAPDRSVLEGILEERERLASIKTTADKVFDTSDLTVHELRHAFMDLSRASDQRLVVTLASFGYKHGIPLEADLLFDVRFLPNPYFVPELRPLTGKDRGVQDYIADVEGTEGFLERITELLRFLIPRYAREGKSYLTVAIGCTGGRHRSVAMVEWLRRRLARLDGARLRVRHRDVMRE